MQDFCAPVHVTADRAGFWLVDEAISQGTYAIEVKNGPVFIESGDISKEINARAENGPITLRFTHAPKDLTLDTTACGPVVERPDAWPAIYRVGSGTPKITLANTGKAVIEVREPEQ